MRPKRLALLSIWGACALTPLPSLAATQAESVALEQAWVRQPPPRIPAAGAFMTLRNHGSLDAKLTGASNTASKSTELHTHLQEDGMMKMRRVPAISIKSGGETALKPGGYHIMLIDLTAPLQEGDRVAFVLEFEDGSKKQVSIPVKKPGAGY